MSEAALAPSNFPLAQTAESEERLVSRAQEGDEAAFGELAERYFCIPHEGAGMTGAVVVQ
jgi:plastocyanin